MLPPDQQTHESLVPPTPGSGAEPDEEEWQEEDALMQHEVNASCGEESRPDGSHRYRTPRREVPRIGKRPEQCDAKPSIGERVQKAVGGHREGRGRPQGDSGKAHRPGDESEKKSTEGRKGERMSGSPMAKWRGVGDPETEREDIEVRKARAHDQQDDPGRGRHACRRASRASRSKTYGDFTYTLHLRCSIHVDIPRQSSRRGPRDLQSIVGRPARSMCTCVSLSP